MEPGHNQALGQLQQDSPVCLQLKAALAGLLSFYKVEEMCFFHLGKIWRFISIIYVT